MSEEKIRISRSSIYAGISPSSEVQASNRLCFQLPPLPSTAEILEKLCDFYIRTNLFHFYSDQDVFSSDLEDLTDRILALPNITGGGALYPKRESILVYNEICRFLHHGFNGFFGKVKRFALPTVRFKQGKKATFKKKPYATDKIHSDAWVGHFGDAIFSYGVMGDFEDTGVELFNARKLHDDFLEKIDDYDEGSKKYEGIEKIGSLNEGKAVLFDHLVLHRTMKENEGGFRVSIDLGIIMESDVHDSYRTIKNADMERFDYLPIDQLREIGETHIFATRENLRQTADKVSRGITPEKPFSVRI